MFMGENLSPDFTAFDYVIGFDFLDFGDRYFRLPFVFYFENAIPWTPKKLDRKEAAQLLKEKKYFCNFIYGHQSASNIREAIFKRLNEYKQVISPGRFLNNMNTTGCNWREKHQFLSQSKFTIACDSICYPGFVTEKILDPFIYQSIPVYGGSTRIGEDFNTKAFVHCKSLEDVENAVQEVIRLDQDDEAYLDMFTEYPYTYEKQLEDIYEKLEAFLLNIFEPQPKESSRRIKYFCAENHCEHLNRYRKNYERTPNFLRKLF